MVKPRTSRSNSKQNGASGGFPTTPAAPPTPAAAEVKKNVVPINLEDEIRRRAYELFEQRGGAPGNEQDDWLRAESEVLARYQQTA
ncbi:MAG: DUF2934 domain-containing protein [Acidobacteria bacterium]|nr:DUF2934 domain-containing protein [Acidobacteriota bacterium]